MRVDGEWLACDDGIVRPVLRAEVLTGHGTWRSAEFLIDTGADRTVFSANLLHSLDLPVVEASSQIGGLGGLARCVAVDTQVRADRTDGNKTILRGQFAACVDPEALDMSVLGRDTLELFALIVDRNGGVLTILGGNDVYSIHRN